jgi:DNA-binding CsgD family transcriptional regulator
VLLGILDHFAIGILLVDERANVLHANSAARALLGQELQLSAIASDMFPFGRLRGCIRSVVCRASGRALALRSGETDRPLFVMVAPVQARAGEAAVSANWPSQAALVILCDLDGPASLPVGSMAEAYGLTEAEARVAEAASGGARISAIARHLGLSPNTIKTHLRRVYEKTGTKHHAELARVTAMIGFARANVGE